jgi:hypothetical protein
MPKFYYNPADGSTLAADTPEQESAADADVSLVPLADENDTPFERAVEFSEPSTGDILEARSQAAYDAAKANKDLFEITKSPEQIERERRQERALIQQRVMTEQASFGEKVADSTLATLYGYGQALGGPLFTGIRRLGGVSPEEQEAFEEEHKAGSRIGAGLGIVGSLAATWGIGAAARLAGAEAATAAAAAGGGRIAQGLAAARAAGSVTSATRAGRAAELLAAPATVGAKVAGAVGAGLEAATAGATKALPAAVAPFVGAAGAAARGATAAGLSAIPVAAAYEYNESLLQNRKMSSEAVLHNAMLAAPFGALEGVVPMMAAIGGTEAGQRAATALGRSQATQIINKYDRRFLQKAAKQLRAGPEAVIKRVKSAIDQGYLGMGKSLERSSDDISQGLKETGEVIGQLAEEATVRQAGKLVDTTPMLEKISDEVIAPLASSIGAEDVAAVPYLTGYLDRIKANYPNGMSPKDLSDVRTAISKDIYGLKDLLDPQRGPRSNNLRKMRDIMTEELGGMFENAGIDKRVWKRAQDQYGILSTAEDLIEAGMKNEAARAAVRGDVVSGALGAGLTLAAETAMGVPFDPLYAATAAGVGVAAKRGVPIAYNWALGAMRRALAAGAAPEVIEDLQLIARQQAARAEGFVPSIVEKPIEEARARYRDLATMMQLAAKDTSLSAETVKALESANKALLKIPGTRLPGVGQTQRMLGPDMVSALEDVDKGLETLARASAKRIPNATDADVLRGISQQIKNALSEPGLWGLEHAERAREYYRTLAATRTDPARVLMLEGLDQATLNLQRNIDTRVSRLMGGDSSRFIPIAHPFRGQLSKEENEERERFKKDVLEYHFER